MSDKPLSSVASDHPIADKLYEWHQSTDPDRVTHSGARGHVSLTPSGGG
jgi:hypothetical protein